MYPFTLHTLQARYSAAKWSERLDSHEWMLGHFLGASSVFIGCIREPGYDMRLTNDLPSECPSPGSLPRERGEGRHTYDLSFGGKDLPWDMTNDETHWEEESDIETYEQEQANNIRDYE